MDPVNVLAYVPIVEEWATLGVQNQSTFQTAVDMYTFPEVMESAYDIRMILWLRAHTLVSGVKKA